MFTKSYFTLFIVFALTAAGCTHSSTTSSGSPNSPEKATNDTDFKLIVTSTLYDENEETDGTKIRSFDKPEPAKLQEEFVGCVWTNPLHHCSMTLSKGGINSENPMSLGIVGRINSSDPKEQLHAQWSEKPAGQKKWEHYISAPISSPEIAVELMTSFLVQDDKYRKLVEWHQ